MSMRKLKDSGVEWIGKIPEGWSIGRVKNLFFRKDAKAQQENPVVLSLARSGVKIRDLSKNEGQLAESYFNYNPVEPGDLLLNPMDLYSGANCSISHVSGVISPAYINLKANAGVNPVFYDYYFKTQYWSMSMFAHGKGVSYENRWTMGMDTLNNYYIPVPSSEEQDRIADYLDKKCSAIDDVLAKTQDSIEEYKKLKLAVITEAVTKGVRGKRPMKDSGIDWIGQIPKDWGVQKLKYQITFIESGVSVNAGQTEAEVNQVGVLKTSSVSKQVFDIHENKCVNPEEISRVECPVRANTIIVSRMNTPELVGACGYVEKDYDNIYLPDRLWQVHFIDNACVKFVYYWLTSANIRYYYSSLAVGTSSSMQNISQDQFYHAFIPSMDIIEQQEIADYLDKKCAAIDTLISKKQQFIEELTVYKKSLIYEYVTGKKEVPA